MSFIVRHTAAAGFVARSESKTNAPAAVTRALDIANNHSLPGSKVEIFESTGVGSDTVIATIACTKERAKIEWKR